jgi:hypothetical protein
LYTNLSFDNNRLFLFAPVEINPCLGTNTTWVGHLRDFFDLQIKLAELVALAKAFLARIILRQIIG